MVFCTVFRNPDNFMVLWYSSILPGSSFKRSWQLTKTVRALRETMFIIHCFPLPYSEPTRREWGEGKSDNCWGRDTWDHLPLLEATGMQGNQQARQPLRRSTLEFVQFGQHWPLLLCSAGIYLVRVTDRRQFCHHPVPDILSTVPAFSLVFSTYQRGVQSLIKVIYLSTVLGLNVRSNDEI